MRAHLLSVPSTRACTATEAVVILAPSCPPPPPPRSGSRDSARPSSSWASPWVRLHRPARRQKPPRHPLPPSTSARPRPGCGSSPSRRGTNTPRAARRAGCATR
ncbi:Hypothetical protein AA314_08261 [Archangium gephyra]|uniref:Uncharacterized protein n=1 Tax=Archangium gephyra TaxID=48 RepID=A0AAC8QGH8_9BACT|nr:Hypothetical protein AA314_08261 [Archangium gephyra]